MEAENQQCPRCHRTFSTRKINSLSHTFAWTIAALVMLVPANLYPMMIYYTLGKPEASTILEGIATFVQFGMYPVAIVIFIASFVVPLAKIIGLFILMYHAKRASKLTVKQQGQLYHIVEFLGPWSMLDVFVVAIMAAVVNLGFLSSIEAAKGITYFGLMVVFTMLAAESFDARLLWDVQKDDVQKDDVQKENSQNENTCKHPPQPPSDVGLNQASQHDSP
ncbi:paraquat-inducible protein A [Thalassotalea euphylliae]|nr:paraquat-inducible protein A [Thalassotalea euphylliae]